MTVHIQCAVSIPSHLFHLKVLFVMTNLFSNINLDSIQETYPKIRMYNKIIAQFVEVTNLMVKTFQVAGHDYEQQMPKQLAP